VKNVDKLKEIYLFEMGEAKWLSEVKNIYNIFYKESTLIRNGRKISINFVNLKSSLISSNDYKVKFINKELNEEGNSFALLIINVEII